MTWWVDKEHQKVTYHLGISHAHPYVLSGGSAGRIERLAEYLDKVDELILSDRKHVTVHGEYKNVPITAFSTGMGPASVGITLPEVIEACDSDQMVIIRLGTSGAAQRGINIGNLVISTVINSYEGTSKEIMDDPHYVAVACPDVVETLEEEARVALKKLYKSGMMFGEGVHVGPTKVVQELYWHAKKMTKPCPEGSLAVSMEFSVYCALRDRYNKDFGKKIKAGNLLVVSDNPLEEQKQADMTQFEQRKAAIENAQVKAGLETLVRMSKEK